MKQQVGGTVLGFIVGVVVGLGFLLEIEALGGRERLKGHLVESLATY